MRAVVVYNPQSGSALPVDDMRKLFSSAGIDVETFIDVTGPLKETLAPYVRQRGYTVIGYGGDGTLRSIAAVVTGSGAVFAPLPGGTLNHFTKDLGVDQDLEAAIASLANAATSIIDVATVNGRLFLNNSSIGLYPTSLIERSKLEHRIGKWPAAVYAAAIALIKFRVHTVTIDGKEYRTPFVFVGNNAYDPTALMRRTRIDAGVLSVFIIESTSRLSLVKILLLSLFGKTAATSGILMFKTDKLIIGMRKKRVRVSFDGEHEQVETPLQYEIKKRSLRVLA